MKRMINASSIVKKGERLTVLASTANNENTILGPVDDLPYKRLLEGTSAIGLKELEGREGQTLYLLATDYSHKEKRYYLEPFEIISFRVEKPGDSMWVKYTEYHATAKSLTTGRQRFFDNTIGFSSPALFTESDADKLIDNAEKILAEKDFLTERSNQVDKTLVKQTIDSIPRDSKIVKADIFGNGEAKVSLGATSGDSDHASVCVFIHVSPTDGPFMNSSLYEVFFKPMTDGVVYRSYGAFSHAVGDADWFLDNKKVAKLTVDEMNDQIDRFIEVYNNIEDDFNYEDVSRQIHAIF